MFNATFNASWSVHLMVPVKKVGNSLAIFIPADKAREFGLREGDLVDAHVQPKAPHLLGMFKGIGPYTRADKKEAWPDDE